MKHAPLSWTKGAAIAMAGAGLLSFLSPPVKADSAPPAGELAVGKAVRPFTLPKFDGARESVGNWNGAKATVVIFVSTHCPVSGAYNGRMIALEQTYGPRGVRIFGVDANKQETPDNIAAFVKEKGFNFPWLKDSGNAIADRFGARVTPEAYVIDSSGTLRYWGRIDDSKEPEGVTTHDLANALDAVLAGRAVPAGQSPAFGCGIKRVG